MIMMYEIKPSQFREKDTEKRAISVWFGKLIKITYNRNIRKIRQNLTDYDIWYYY